MFDFPWVKNHYESKGCMNLDKKTQETPLIFGLTFSFFSCFKVFPVNNYSDSNIKASPHQVPAGWRGLYFKGGAIAFANFRQKCRPNTLAFHNVWATTGIVLTPRPIERLGPLGNVFWRFDPEPAKQA
jgi:hypothetical protein